MDRGEAERLGAAGHGVEIEDGGLDGDRPRDVVGPFHEDQHVARLALGEHRIDAGEPVRSLFARHPLVHDRGVDAGVDEERLEARRITRPRSPRIVPDARGDAVAEREIGGADGLRAGGRGEGRCQSEEQTREGEARDPHGTFSSAAAADRFSAGQRIRTWLPSKETTGRSRVEATEALAFTRPLASRSRRDQARGAAASR